jgi:hypothetical protein
MALPDCAVSAEIAASVGHCATAVRAAPAGVFAVVTVLPERAWTGPGPRRKI